MLLLCLVNQLSIKQTNKQIPYKYNQQNIFDLENVCICIRAKFLTQISNISNINKKIKMIQLEKTKLYIKSSSSLNIFKQFVINYKFHVAFLISLHSISIYMCTYIYIYIRSVLIFRGLTHILISPLARSFPNIFTKNTHTHFFLCLSVCHKLNIVYLAYFYIGITA